MQQQRAVRRQKYLYDCELQRADAEAQAVQHSYQQALQLRSKRERQLEQAQAHIHQSLSLMRRNAEAYTCQIERCAVAAAEQKRARDRVQLRVHHDLAQRRSQAQLALQGAAARRLKAAQRARTVRAARETVLEAVELALAVVQVRAFTFGAPFEGTDQWRDLKYCFVQGGQCSLDLSAAAEPHTEVQDPQASNVEYLVEQYCTNPSCSVPAASTPELLQTALTAFKNTAEPRQAVTDSVNAFSAKALKICLVGPPQSSRSEQAARLAERYHLNLVSWDGVVQARSNDDWPLAPFLRHAQSATESATADAVVQALRDKLAGEPSTADCTTSSCGWVVDGYPETAEQAAALHRRLEQADACGLDVSSLEGELLLLRLSGGASQDAADETAVHQSCEAFCPEVLRAYHSSSRSAAAATFTESAGIKAVTCVTQASKAQTFAVLAEAAVTHVISGTQTTQPAGAAPESEASKDVDVANVSQLQVSAQLATAIVSQWASVLQQRRAAVGQVFLELRRQSHRCAQHYHSLLLGFQKQVMQMDNRQHILQTLTWTCMQLPRDMWFSETGRSELLLTVERCRHELWCLLEQRRATVQGSVQTMFEEGECRM